MNHAVLTDPELHGFEYGMLNDFVDEIARITGANRVINPHRKLPRYVNRRVAHGTRYGGLRRYIPKAEHEFNADVLWAILMGPENFTLDLFKGWDSSIGVKILYLFDTLESQLPVIKRLLEATTWDYTITSFAGAKPFLEKNTRRKWYVVPQGVKLERFRPAPEEHRVIDFCSYGRRVDKIHNSIKQYSREIGVHYDYTVASALQSNVNPLDSYEIYAWHLRHSIFNLCWPVELTNPRRVRSFSPITCRWFEAAASCNVIVGQPPIDTSFEEIFGAGAVIKVDGETSAENLRAQWQRLWEARHEHLYKAAERWEMLSHNWSWESRVLEILEIAGLQGEQITYRPNGSI